MEKYGYITESSMRKISEQMKKLKREIHTNHPTKRNYNDLENGIWAYIQGPVTTSILDPNNMLIDKDIHGLCAYRWIAADLDPGIEIDLYCKIAGLVGNISYPGLEFVNNVMTGDFRIEQDENRNNIITQSNYAVEVEWLSPAIPFGELVYLMPSVEHDFFTFIYPPRTKIFIIEEDIPAATLDNTFKLTPGSGNGTILSKFNYNHITLEPRDANAPFGNAGFNRTYQIMNPFRQSINVTDKAPAIAQCTFGDGGYWWINSVECKPPELFT